MVKSLRILVPGAYFISIVILWPRLMSPYLFSSPVSLPTFMAGLVTTLTLVASLSIGWQSSPRLRFHSLFLGGNIVTGLGIIGVLRFRNDGPLELYIPIILFLLGGAIISTTAFLKYE